MSLFARTLILSVALIAPLHPFVHAQSYASSADAGPPNQRAEAEQIFALANQARAQAGAGRLEWDPALAEAALYHCRRMVHEGPIAHRYGGEPDLAARASEAGARFGVVEENIAIGPSAEGIHDEWMNSPGHRANLLSPDVDRVGVAVIASRGVLYAVADYAQGVPTLSPAQVEARVASLIRVSGVTILGNPSLARAACATDSGVPRSAGGLQPRFVMRWQDSDLARLPQALVDRLGSGNYRQASVGSCPAQGGQSSFAAYRVAVLLY
jgi:Cysteine-rich secretory protein family